MEHFSENEEHEISFPSGDVELDGFLYIPEQAKGIVLFVHGSGSSRFSSRNQHVAKLLNEAGLATLLFDLLTAEEDAIDQHTREFRFDIGLLATRLIGATEWAHQTLPSFDIGYFGSSTGGGAALVAAAEKTKEIKAIVSRGGRPDLANEFLPHVQAPTLLIVGGEDQVVIEMNESAKKKMRCHAKLEIVPGATHLFEEPGKLDEVAKLTKDWFINHFNSEA